MEFLCDTLLVKPQDACQQGKKCVGGPTPAATMAGQTDESWQGQKGEQLAQKAFQSQGNKTVYYKENAKHAPTI